MQKIGFLVTGGTIGMQTVAGKSNIPYKYLDHRELFPDLDKIADIYTHSICNLDSSAIAIEQWQLIVNSIYENRSKYDGFVISHGTDSMVYSASAIAYAFSTFMPCPIIFTGSQRTPDMPNSDAKTNIQDALKVACGNKDHLEERIAEVSIVFGGNIWRACRALKLSNSNDNAFGTPFTPPLGNINGNKLKLATHAKRLSMLGKQNSSAFAPYFSDKIILLHSVPGFKIGKLTALTNDKDWSLALIIAMGAGNLPLDTLAFIEMAIKRQKHIVIMSPTADRADTNYPPLRAALMRGAIFANGYTLSGLWAKCSWILGGINNLAKKLDYAGCNSFIKNELAKNYIGEINKLGN